MNWSNSRQSSPAQRSADPRAGGVSDSAVNKPLRFKAAPQQEQHQLERQADDAALQTRTPLLNAVNHSETQTERQIPGLGKPLDPGLRKSFEGQYQQDFRGVRIHDDQQAAQSAEELGARAYAVGKDIMLGRDINLHRPEGVRVLAHELAHVVQQQQPGAGHAVQCDDESPQGIGRRPPEGDFVTMEGRGVEDGHVLFSRDTAILGADDETTLRDLIGERSEPVTVHVHGYASLEGDDDYNMNLSAHRAIVVKNFLEELLPEGSRVVAYARGETRDFGNLADNRRVGVDVIERAAPGSLLRMRTDTPTVGLSPGRLTLMPRIDFSLDQELAVPMTDLLPEGPQQDPFTLPPMPLAPGGDLGFDVGALAPLYNARGMNYSARDANSAEEHFTFWRDRYIQWGLPPERAQWLSQLGTERAMGRQIMLENPTDMEATDLLMGTEPTIIPLMNDSMMRWLFEQWR